MILTRTVIDIDDDNLAIASRILGTKTKVATVNAALAEVAKRDKQYEAAMALARGLPDLADPEIMKGASRSFDFG